MNGYHDIAIVGAGPYGLSIAAHLRTVGVSFRVYGSPLHTWRHRMPGGMLLKSDGFASNLSDPASAFTLERFCQDAGIPYDDTRIPVSLETFNSYGMAFQKRFVPELEENDVTSIVGESGLYRMHLSDGRAVTANNVVLAVGITHFDYIPPVLAGLPARFLSHASAHRDLARFRGVDVTVIGGGASAIDLAVLLAESGAHVTVIAHRPLKFHGPPSPDGRSLWERARHPNSTIGPGWRNRLYTDAPWLFHRLPQDLRLSIVGKHMASAAGGYPMKSRFAGKVHALEGYDLRGVDVRNDRVHIVLGGHAGVREHVTDQVIAATGYRVDLRRLSFLSNDIQARIHAVQASPILSSAFESSVPGLYFVGFASMNSFGPMMRFACGADWTARRLSMQLAKSRTIERAWVNIDVTAHRDGREEQRLTAK